MFPDDVHCKVDRKVGPRISKILNTPVIILVYLSIKTKLKQVYIIVFEIHEAFDEISRNRTVKKKDKW